MKTGVRGASAAFAVALAAFLCWTATDGRAQDRTNLWKLVAMKCLAHLSRAEAPIPCDAVDNSRGWDKGLAFLKDLSGAAQMLAIPTHPLSGIEDPALLTADEPNYFAMARPGRGNAVFHLRRPLKLEFIAIVANARANRAHDQFHLRIDCLNPVVVEALKTASAEIAASWAPMKTPLQGRIYWARKLSPDEVSGASPVRLLADGVDGAKTDLSEWSIAMIDAAVEGDKGELLLAIKSDREAGDAEALEDHSCAIAQVPEP